MFNPLKKIMDFLGITGVQGRDMPNWNPGQDRGTAPDTKVPLTKRVATRRRKNKAARRSRQKNRS